VTLAKIISDITASMMINNQRLKLMKCFSNRFKNMGTIKFQGHVKRPVPPQVWAQA
jgi:hypothetical protein